jgi:sulfatase maturation enzyme AslB (radical SAM superfamily)
MTTFQHMIQDNKDTEDTPPVPFDESKRRDYLRVQIITDSNCNLACDYCVLLYKDQAYKEERALSDQTSEAYIDFFSSHYEEILKYYR